MSQDRAPPPPVGRRAAVDFYERGILNGIVGNQKRAGEAARTARCSRRAAATPRAVATTTRRRPPQVPLRAGAASPATSYIYMLPLGGAVQKPWGKSDYGFPCCWGTLSESFAKLSDTVFFTSADGAGDGGAASTFYVNLFVSATAQWAARPGVTVEQVAHFPTDPTRTSRSPCA